MVFYIYMQLNQQTLLTCSACEQPLYVDQMLMAHDACMLCSHLPLDTELLLKQDREARI